MNMTGLLTSYDTVDLRELESWQASPHGRASHATHTLIASVWDLAALAGDRATHHCVQAELTDIAVAYSKLGRLIELLQANREAA